MNDDTAKQLTKSAQKHREWAEKRDELIVKARQEGGSLREIAGLAGLSHTAVAKIAARANGELS